MNIIIFGSGVMAKLVADLVKESTELNFLGMIDKRDYNEEEGIFPSLEQFSDGLKGKINGIIDFSHPSNLDEILNFSKKYTVPTLIATTGFSNSDIEKMKEHSKDAPIIFTQNTSIGINLLSQLVRKVTQTLGEDYDIEIIEKHHNKKLDSPSGTAKLLYNSIKEVRDVEAVYGREGMKKRENKDVGIHSVRGGTIVGEHSVIFAGLDEIIEIKHEALSKNIFAKGALKGIKYLKEKENGFYSMADVLGL